MTANVSANAKKISQSTFDDVVRENIVELGLDSVEAVDDACKQLTAQALFGCSLCLQAIAFLYIITYFFEESFSS